MDEQVVKFLNKALMLAATLVVGIFIYLGAQVAYQSQMLDHQNQNQITISGQGKVYAKPDVAVISLGVTTQATTVADVTKSNTDKMNAVIDAVKNLGVDEKDIQTTNYNLSPRYDSKIISSTRSYYASEIYTESSNNAIIGYTLDQNVQVKIRDFAKISDIISQATAKGSNLVGSLQFTIDDPEQFKDEARAQAIAEAKANAQNLAKESGIKLGKIINVYESNYYAPAAYDSLKGMGGGVSIESVSTPTIQPGQQEINITVNLTYKIK
jgi:hypothetical protein